MPCGLKERFCATFRTVRLDFTFCARFSKRPARLKRSYANAQGAGSVRIALGDTRYSCISFLHEMRGSFSRIKRGFVSFSFQNMAHIGLYLASLHLYNAVRSHAKEYHPAATRLLCIHWASGQIRLSPPAAAPKSFLQAKREAALPPFLFLCCFYSASKVAVIASLFCTART